MRTRRLLIAAFSVISVIALALPGRPASAEDYTCEKCEAECYRTAENIPDYNACVMLCNYAYNCRIPPISN
jgi:hypothetical protein